MYNNGLIDLHHQVQGQLWVDRLNDAHARGQLCPWVSTFHTRNLACELEGTFYHGSFNAGVKMVFGDGEAWMVRFPRVGKVHDKYADEKVAMEVRALRLLRERTTIPVPMVRAWGSAADNTLGLGPFIMMDFIHGACLNDLLIDPNEADPTRLIREDACDGDIEVIYRQMANFMLQIFDLDFESDRSKGFATTTEYFEYLLGQDFQQLNHQPNSVYGPNDAKSRYLALKVLASLLPEFINKTYDKGKFKLICDDLGLANLIVRSEHDLTVVGVVDLEWSYTGPAQLFGSAPWWLLQDRPVNEEWEWHDGKPPALAKRYDKHLEMYKRVLTEEEAKMPGHEAKQLSTLVEWSQISGAMWLHMLLSVGFNDHRSFPFTQLRQHIGEKEWSRRLAAIASCPEVGEFVTRKTSMLQEYEAAVDALEEDKALLDRSGMTREAFLAKTLPTATSYLLNRH
ncbi:Protein kinase-like domain protein [Niveomyces insectorum RCEF 264]|uniref:Protein kinase-like domain protein n=1 Tax=Niveomyces insectorum RCEF 264 TaxID=1081102 RepID=A0A167T8X3_9HYPO|nr:Protein kinase-like domain protein [Niveomyces insectorum RCEF 264]